LHPRSVKKDGYHAGLESRSAAIKSTLDQSSARYGSVRLQPKIGRSERTSSERGLSGLQSESDSFTASCCLPYPKKRLSAKPKAQKYYLAPTAINHSSKLMSAMQELFQLFSCLFQLCRRCFVRRQNQSSRRVGDAQGIRKSISICLELWGLSPSLRSGFSRRGIPVAGRTGWSGTED
jgi:hypothetical protein